MSLALKRKPSADAQSPSPALKRRASRSCSPARSPTPSLSIPNSPTSSRKALSASGSIALTPRTTPVARSVAAPPAPALLAAVSPASPTFTVIDVFSQTSRSIRTIVTAATLAVKQAETDQQAARAASQAETQQLRVRAEEAAAASVAATAAVQQAEERVAIEEVTQIQRINRMKTEAVQSGTSLQQTEELLSAAVAASSDLIVGPKIVAGHGVALYGASFRGLPYCIVAPKCGDMRRLITQDDYFCRVRVENETVAPTRSGNWNSAMVRRKDFLKHGPLEVMVQDVRPAPQTGGGASAGEDDVKSLLCKLDADCTVGQLRSILALVDGTDVACWQKNIAFADPENKDSVVVLEDDSSRLTSHGVQAGSALTLVLAH